MISNNSNKMMYSKSYVGVMEAILDVMHKGFCERCEFQTQMLMSEYGSFKYVFCAECADKHIDTIYGAKYKDLYYLGSLVEPPYFKRKEEGRCELVK